MSTETSSDVMGHTSLTEAFHEACGTPADRLKCTRAVQRKLRGMFKKDEDALELLKLMIDAGVPVTSMIGAIKTATAETRSLAMRTHIKGVRARRLWRSIDEKQMATFEALPHLAVPA